MATSSLWPHQQTGVEWLIHHPQGLLWDEPRLGKTRQIICAAQSLRLHKLLVLVGRTYAETWRHELTMNGIHSVLMLDDYASRRERIGNDLSSAEWVILTRQAISQTKSYNVLEALLTQTWNALVLDEHHHFRNPKTKLAKAVMQIPAQVRWGLSATPTDGDPRDLWWILNWLYPKTYGTFWQFAKRYCKFKYNGFGWEYEAPQHEEELANRLSLVSLRRTQQEVRPNLPPIHEQVIWLQLYPGERKLYDDMEEHMLTWLNENEALAAPTQLAQLTRLRQLAADSYALGSKKPSRKADALVEYILEQRRPTVVVFEFKDAVEHLAQKLNDASVQTLTLTGDTRSPSTVLQQFREGRAGALLMTGATGGEGINLSCAEDLVIAAEPWSSILAEQTRHRITALDDMRQKNLTRFVVRDTVEEDIHNLLLTKQRVNAKLLVSELRKSITRRIDKKE